MQQTPKNQPRHVYTNFDRNHNTTHDAIHLLFPLSIDNIVEASARQAQFQFLSTTTNNVVGRRQSLPHHKLATSPNHTIPTTAESTSLTLVFPAELGLAVALEDALEDAEGLEDVLLVVLDATTLYFTPQTMSTNYPIYHTLTILLPLTLKFLPHQ